MLPLVDDLSFGPLDSTTHAQRDRWCSDELGFEVDPEMSQMIDEFWRRVASLRTKVVAWMSRRDVAEYCGFRELLWRTPGTPVSVIDVADVEFVWRDGTAQPDTSMAFARVGDPQIVKQGLIDRAVRVSTSDRDVYRAEWQILRNENAALRALTPTGLISTPITYFDDAILSCVTNEWQRCGRVPVVGNALNMISPGPYRQLSADRVLFSRLLTLMDDQLEGRTDNELWSIQLLRRFVGSQGSRERRVRSRQRRASRAATPARAPLLFLSGPLNSRSGRRGATTQVGHA